MLEKLKASLRQAVNDFDELTDLVDMVALLLFILSVIFLFSGQFIAMALVWIVIVLKPKNGGISK